MAAVLIEELLEAVLLRIPPDDPASLVRAALVSKRWCRLICGRGFRRRFREFHGAPPLLGFVCHRDNIYQDPFFIPSSSFRPRNRDLADDSRCMQPVHSYHGGVLLHSTRWFGINIWVDLFVWDPITNKLRNLPRWPLYCFRSCSQRSAAILCADAVVGDGCNHLDCHHGHFMVVFVGVDQNSQIFTSVYSSQDDRWREPICAAQRYYNFDMEIASIVVRNAVYFKCCAMNTNEPAILKFDLLTREVSLIHIPRVGNLKHIDYEHTALTATEGGSRLGFAFTTRESIKPKLNLWSRENDSPGEDARWAQSRVMDLEMLLKTELRQRAYVVAFADTGAGGVIFIWTGDRLFSFDLKSGSSKMVGRTFATTQVVPYMSFCTPAMGAVSLDEAPGGPEPSA